jgi:hypothetical protein
MTQREKIKSIVLLILLLVGGLYILGFGIYTISITQMFISGLVLIGYGLLLSMFSSYLLYDMGK